MSKDCGIFTWGGSGLWLTSQLCRVRPFYFMEKEYYFTTGNGFESVSDTFEAAEIMADYYDVCWLSIKCRNVFVDCDVRDGNI